jgi:hypothetical protein
MNTRCARRRARLLDEVRDLVAQRIDLDDEADDGMLLVFAQLDQPVEDRFPVLVAGEIVVGDEEARDALRDIGAHDRSTSSGERRRDLRPCTLMMVQNEHW